MALAIVALSFCCKGVMVKTLFCIVGEVGSGFAEQSIIAAIPKGSQAKINVSRFGETVMVSGFSESDEEDAQALAVALLQNCNLVRPQCFFIGLPILQGATERFSRRYWILEGSVLVEREIM